VKPYDKDKYNIWSIVEYPYVLKNGFLLMRLLAKRYYD